MNRSPILTAGVFLLTALFAPAADPGPRHTFTTLAGTPGGPGLADGPAARAQYNSPLGIAVDSTGNIYVADAGNLVVRRISPDGEVTTLAGMVGAEGTDDGTGGSARFQLPYGLAVDSTGNVYVADAAAHTIRKITRFGAVTTLAGSPENEGSNNGTGTGARFRSPRGLAVDSTGNVYVADHENHMIRRVTPTGVVSTFAGSAGAAGFADGPALQARFFGPSGLAFDTAGNLYVTDERNNIIRKISPGGTVSTLAGGAGIEGYLDATGNQARFDEPVGIAVNAAGTVFVVDTENNRIRRITPAGVVTTYAGAGPGAGVGHADGEGPLATFRFPNFLALDRDGNLIVTDGGNSMIRRIASDGTVTTLSGLPDSRGALDGIGEDAQFRSPGAVAVDASGVVFVADSENHTIRRITPGGGVTLFAGAAGISGSVNGRGADARFNRPEGVSTDGAGNVYVADTGNHTIRKITAAGVVTTLAGSAGEFGTTNGPGGAARFRSPRDVFADTAGNVYVADSGNHLIRRVSPTGEVTTIAGGAGQAGFTDGLGSAARFSSPYGVTLHVPSGALYVVDFSGRTVRKISTAGEVTTIAGAPGVAGTHDGVGESALFTRPTKIALDPEGLLYVVDRDAHTIRRVNSNGVVTTLAGAPFVPGNTNGTGLVTRFFAPQGITADRAGNLYVADTANNTIRWGALAVPARSSSPTANANVGQPFTYTVTFTGVVAGPYAANGLPPGLTFNSGTGVISGAPTVPGTFAIELSATNGAGTGTDTLTLAIAGGNAADEAYTFTTLAGAAGVGGTTNGTGIAARFSRLTGVAVDGAGNVFVTDTENHTIRKISNGGIVATFAGTPGVAGTADGNGAAARFRSPYGIAVDKVGNVFVTDSGNHTIRRITPTGGVTTLAGSAGNAGSSDGNGTTARFLYPEGIALDRAGNLLVADTENHTIRRITPGGDVTTLAGTAGSAGATDAPRTGARFNFPSGIGVDSSGNVYVADVVNHTIRKITSAGVVSTLAGTAGAQGDTNGTGPAARFRRPRGLAVDGAGNIFVSEATNNLIRKITSAGLVSTLGGAAGIDGATNGTGATALFRSPLGVAVDTAGNIYVADTHNFLVRWGALTTPTLASSPVATGAVGQRFSYASRFAGTLVGPYSAVSLPAGLTINAVSGLVSGTPTVAGTFAVTLNATNGAGTRGSTLALTISAAPPVLTAQPADVVVAIGGPATFSVRAGGTPPLSYQWRRNGVPITGATQATLALRTTTAADAGSYSVTVSNSLGQVTSAAGVLTVNPLSALSNLSVRTALAAGQTLIVGAVISGGSKEILVRAAGPALNRFGLAGQADPRLELFTTGVLPAAANEDWPDGLASVFTSLGAFPFDPGSRDAALAQPTEGSFTVQARGSGAGAVLVEAYDVRGGVSPRLVNLSARNHVGTGADILIAGFTVSGDGTKQLLIRAIGPALTSFGVSGALTDPRLQVFDSSGAVIATNDNWDASLASHFTQVGAFPLTAGSRDAALLVTLRAGASYTVQVAGADGGSGEALVEIYEVF